MIQRNKEKKRYLISTEAVAVTQADRLSALPAHRVETVVSSVIFNLIHHKIRLQKVINKAFFKATILNHLVRVPLNPGNDHLIEFQLIEIVIFQLIESFNNE